MAEGESTHRNRNRAKIGNCMNDAQQMYEFKIIHRRCNDQAEAINTLTQAVSANILRERAYDNLINGSWILTRWLSARKLEKEMESINELERKLHQQEISVREAILQNEQVRVEGEAAVAAREKKTNEREKEARRLVKKARKKP